MKPQTLRNNKTGLLLLTLLASFQAQAAAILTADNRYMEADLFVGNDFYDTGYRTAWWDYELWQDQGGTGMSVCVDYACNTTIDYGVGADQTSATDYIYGGPYTANRFYGTGMGSAYIHDPSNSAPGGTAGGESVYDISFTLLDPHAYNLTGTLTTSGSGYARLQLGDINLSATGSPFAYSGILAPGDYRLQVSALAYVNSIGDAFARYDFDLRLTEVPLPAAAWLFGSGMVGLLGFARRRTSSK